MCLKRPNLGEVSRETNSRVYTSGASRGNWQLQSDLSLSSSTYVLVLALVDVRPAAATFCTSQSRPGDWLPERGAGTPGSLGGRGVWHPHLAIYGGTM